jgi:hypothetical protein
MRPPAVSNGDHARRRVQTRKSAARVGPPAALPSATRRCTQVRATRPRRSGVCQSPEIGVRMHGGPTLTPRKCAATAVASQPALFAVRCGRRAGAARIAVDCASQIAAGRTKESSNPGRRALHCLRISLRE